MVQIIDTQRCMAGCSPLAALLRGAALAVEHLVNLTLISNVLCEQITVFYLFVSDSIVELYDGFE